MRVYRANFFDPCEGCLVSWHPDKSSAKAHLDAAIRQRGEIGEVPVIEIVQTVDVLLTGSGILEFLNVHVARDLRI